MRLQVERAIDLLRPTLIAQHSDIELLSATGLGVVTIKLSGDGCAERFTRLRTLLDFEEKLKKEVPGVVVVLEDQ